MSTGRLSLETIEVASPCTVPWEAMSGTNRVRFCHKCQLQVYNLSEMSRDDAEALLTGAQGRACVRFYRRRDGTILTRDCREGPRVPPRLTGRLALVALLVLSALAGLFQVFGGHKRRFVTGKVRCVRPVAPGPDLVEPQEEEWPPDAEGAREE
jgi:hypothetical protein